MLELTITILLQLLGLGLAVGALSWTLTKAKVFEWLRQWIANRNKWLGDLAKCPYCASHWLGAGAVIYYHPILMRSDVYVLDLVVSIFIVVAFASFTGGLIYRTFWAPLYLVEDEE